MDDKQHRYYKHTKFREVTLRFLVDFTRNDPCSRLPLGSTLFGINHLTILHCNSSLRPQNWACDEHSSQKKGQQIQIHYWKTAHLVFHGLQTWHQQAPWIRLSSFNYESVGVYISPQWWGSSPNGSGWEYIIYHLAWYFLKRYTIKLYTTLQNCIIFMNMATGIKAHHIHCKEYPARIGAESRLRGCHLVAVVVVGSNSMDIINSIWPEDWSLCFGEHERCTVVCSTKSH